MPPKAICTHEVIRERLYNSLTSSPAPVFFFGESAIPGPSIWTAARKWVSMFRHLGVAPGERVVLSLDPGPGFLAALVAGIWEEFTLVLPGFGDRPEEVADETKARLILDEETTAGRPGTVTQMPLFVTEPTPAARFLLRSSGTSGRSDRFVALSNENILAVAESHQYAVPPEGSVALSLLPWNHAFGLVLELLPALWSTTMFVRTQDAARDPAIALEWSNRFDVRWANMVPLQAARLAASSGGLAWLRGLDGGIVGGAPVDGALADVLATTKLRPGYGQTEASPGITLGEPGEWGDRCIGQPVGCETEITPDGELVVTGPNVCLGVWEHGALTEFDPNRALHTGDLVERLPSGSLAFVGRTDHRFKLSNGRLVDAPALERDLDGVVLLPDEGGAGVVLALEPGADAGPDVLEYLGRIPARTIRLAEAAPRTRKGEIDRRALQERIRSNDTPRSTHDPSEHASNDTPADLGDATIDSRRAA
ncbi:MAG: class I adenylate-forming enzyme family protein [Planctomycetota bacterium]